MSFTKRINAAHSEKVLDESHLASLLNEDGDYKEIPIEEIQPDVSQPRQNFDEKRLQELAATIKTQGILEPIIVRPNPSEWRRDIDKYVIVTGERRYRAAEIAGLKTVPCSVRDVSASRALYMQMIENLQREELTPREAAQGYARLNEEFDLSYRAIAHEVGKDFSDLTKTVKVYSDESLAAIVDKGDLPLFTVAALLPLPEAQRLPLARQLIKRRQRGETVTVSSVTAEVRALTGKAPRVGNSHTPQLAAVPMPLNFDSPRPLTLDETKRGQLPYVETGHERIGAGNIANGITAHHYTPQAPAVTLAQLEIWHEHALKTVAGTPKYLQILETDATLSSDAKRGFRDKLLQIARVAQQSAEMIKL